MASGSAICRKVAPRSLSSSYDARTHPIATMPTLTLLLRSRSFDSPIPGVGMLLALDSLQHPAALVRASAQRWLLDASSQPQSFLTPLLTLLLGRAGPVRKHLPHALARPTHAYATYMQPYGARRECTVSLVAYCISCGLCTLCRLAFLAPVQVRLHVYALAKLRAALSCMPNTTMPLLSQLSAPYGLWNLCREQMPESLRASLLESNAGSMFKLLVAATFLVLLQPIERVGRSAQALAIELMSSLLHAAPEQSASSLCQASGSLVDVLSTTLGSTLCTLLSCLSRLTLVQDNPLLRLAHLWSRHTSRQSLPERGL